MYRIVLNVFYLPQSTHSLNSVQIKSCGNPSLLIQNSSLFTAPTSGVHRRVIFKGEGGWECSALLFWVLGSDAMALLLGFHPLFWRYNPTTRGGIVSRGRLPFENDPYVDTRSGSSEQQEKDEFLIRVRRDCHKIALRIARLKFGSHLL